MKNLKDRNKLGTSKTIICPDCDGAKTDEQGNICPDCDGKGILEAVVVSQGA